MEKMRIIILMVIFTLSCTLLFQAACTNGEEVGSDVIKVGVLHSLSGTMAISESSLVDATLLAIGEINKEGGVLGKQIQPIVVDGASDWPAFAREAEILITKEEVSAVFGGWTSASRKTMKPVFEEHNNLLFYPVQYEGLERSPNIIYTGAAPNQQVLPAVDWAFENIGTTFYLVGSDYVFPRSAHEIMRERIYEIGGEVLGEGYVLLGRTDFDDIIEDIQQTQPDIILNTVNGDSNLALFSGLGEAGITIPVMSFSIAEDELRGMDIEEMVGDYAVWNYFQSIDSAENKEFVALFHEYYGDTRVTDDPIEAAYIGVYLFAAAVEKAGSTDVDAVKAALSGLMVDAPQGHVTIDPDNQHLYKTVRIGQIQEDGQFEILFTSDEPIKPEPYPSYRTEEEWNAFLDNLYISWGGQWSNPG
jgi:urea transport system substrate-binding protein